MARQTKVVDASVLIKLFVPERGSELAHGLVERHISRSINLVVPELAFLEIMNALRYKKTGPALATVVADLWEFQLHVEHMNPFLMKRAAELAMKHNLSIYDATYLALADFCECSLYTADNELAKCPGTIVM
jgi:predicted nucleic acid-binding protein